jgi:hypothetical protein
MSFAAQQQTVPGVQALMDPVPDCGENSYQGSGKPTGKKAITTQLLGDKEIRVVAPARYGRPSSRRGSGTTCRSGAPASQPS